jgi:hypothetical protein
LGQQSSQPGQRRMSCEAELWHFGKAKSTPESLARLCMQAHMQAPSTRT